MHGSVADHLRAIALFRDVLTRVVATDLVLETPCDGWTVRDLLAHQLGQDLAFTAALRGGSEGLGDWAHVPVGDAAPAPLLAALAAQESALAEFGEPAGALIWMPEILPDRPLPAPRALAAHLLDLLVHSWDLAVSIGAPLDPPEDLVAQSVAVARAIPDDEHARGQGRAFARGLDVTPGASGRAPFDELLLRLGRDPAWTPVER